MGKAYSPESGSDLVRPALADEAIRLTRLVAQLMPQHPEVLALLALELFQHSRAAARLDAAEHATATTAEAANFARIADLNAR